MALGERDPHTGHMTTGHEWNGITELNTPVPRPVYFFLAATFTFAVIYWVLMPAWPLWSTYTKGLLGASDRNALTESLQQAAAAREVWTKRIESEDYATVQADPGLMQSVRDSGRTLFTDNCAVCHGGKATGGPGYPNLTGASWLWGGSPEMVAETLRVGINSGHPEARTSQMLAFGRDQMLSRADVENVTTYVQSLSKPAMSKNADTKSPAAGTKAFETNCISCHGENGKGNPELGAPDLTDHFWIYGGDRQSIYTSIFNGRQGFMPSWEDRLSPLERKILTLYVLDLGPGPK
ncbi:cytochrome-c oxidase, cbb3-type subunit III [Microvirga brassicacearum]|uniref:Cbb3-type cytochrome c oxidase subunit n=1 Tax=Microvirga brassicacearum TaxID=2580413 RepID=A0A5N3PAT4_9HYPH|nr:cytochrome-c oxidase, cbb3-type subunit III [Microvirga brassicacearum]KAB0266847.1 cytochrome-c oxidase, cbb3-type subunit III [Microvirga brassicacearum]